MDGDGATDGGDAGFRQFDVANFGFANQVGHGADGFLDRSVSIDAVLVVQINVIDGEALEAGFASAAGVLGLSVYAARLRIIKIAHNTEFGGQHDLIALAFDRAAHEFFVLEWAVHVGGVEKVAAEFDGPVNGGDGLRFVARSVKFGHAHAAESKGGNGEALRSELAEFHLWLLEEASASFVCDKRHTMI